jgi:hypothetical protein
LKRVLWVPCVHDIYHLEGYIILRGKKHPQHSFWLTIIKSSLPTELGKYFPDGSQYPTTAGPSLCYRQFANQSGWRILRHITSQICLIISTKVVWTYHWPTLICSTPRKYISLLEVSRSSQKKRNIWKWQMKGTSVNSSFCLRGLDDSFHSVANVEE